MQNASDRYLGDLTILYLYHKGPNESLPNQNQSLLNCLKHLRLSYSCYCSLPLWTFHFICPFIHFFLVTLSSYITIKPVPCMSIYLLFSPTYQLLIFYSFTYIYTNLFSYPSIYWFPLTYPFIFLLVLIFDYLLISPFLSDYLVIFHLLVHLYCFLFSYLAIYWFSTYFFIYIFSCPHIWLSTDLHLLVYIYIFLLILLSDYLLIFYLLLYSYFSCPAIRPLIGSSYLAITTLA